MSVDVPKRRRAAPPPIDPPKRRRRPPPQLIDDIDDAERPITVSNFFSRVPNARPLAPGQKSHATCNPSPNDQPDPRMFPCMIVRDSMWMKNIPPTVNERVTTSLSWSDDIDFESKQWAYVYPSFLTEWGLRKHLKKALLSDVIFDKLKAYIEAHEEDWNDVNRSMYVVEDGKITDIGFMQASGPFYLESLLYIEHHFDQNLRKV